MMRLFSNLSQTSRIMMTSVGVICLVMLGLGLIVIHLIYPFEKPLSFVTGLAIGCIQSMIKIILLEKSISHTLDMEKEHATAFASIQAIGRYVLTIAVFAAVLLLPAIFGLFGAILGVLSLQFAAYATNMVLNKME